MGEVMILEYVMPIYAGKLRQAVEKSAFERRLR